ncbi:MAG: hypothetical protein Kow0029_10170 [Candidatus Rifleibacteriota bacterium]
MPKKNRYKELCEAYDKGVEDCNNYRRECREFVQELKSALVEYLQCPETKIFMYQATRGFVFKSHLIQGDAFDTEFIDNGLALIGFAINVNDDDLEDKFFTIVIQFKKIGQEFHFGIIDDDKEFTTENDGIIDFCDYFFKISLKTLRERLTIFLESPSEESAPIGFKVQMETGSKNKQK